MRKILSLIGIIFLIISGIGLFLFATPYEEEQKEIIATYSLNADANYRVHLIPNQLFKEEWMEEGKLYSELLTDYIEVTYKADLKLDRNMDLDGEYTIDAVLEGFETRGEVRKPIYERRYSMEKGEIENHTGNNIRIEKTVKVRPVDHKKYAENAENILGGSTSRELYLLFEGKFTVGEEEKTFSHKLLIPANNQSFYEITKPEPVVDQGELSKTQTVTVIPPLQKYIAFALLGAIGLILLIVTVFFTRSLEGRDLWIADLSKIMRKYASRMICVEKIPPDNGREILRLKDMSSMVALAEELREPVMYCLNREGVPTDGKFYILGSEYLYLLEYPEPIEEVEYLDTAS